MASKIIIVKFDARTRNVNRHKCARMFDEKFKKSTSANIVNAILFLGFHSALKVASKVRTVKYDARMVRCGCDAADFGRHFGDRPWSANLNDPSDTHTHSRVFVVDVFQKCSY